MPKKERECEGLFLLLSPSAAAEEMSGYNKKIHQSLPSTRESTTPAVSSPASRRHHAVRYYVYNKMRTDIFKNCRSSICSVIRVALLDGGHHEVVGHFFHAAYIMYCSSTTNYIQRYSSLFQAPHFSADILYYSVSPKGTGLFSYEMLEATALTILHQYPPTARILAA